MIVSKSFSNLDVFSILRENDIAYINYLMVQNGTIVQTHTIILEIKLDETNEEILILAIIDLRNKFNSRAQEIVIPFPIEYEGNDFTITIPRAGDKKKLLELSEKNVNYFIDEMKRKKMLRLEGKSETEKQKVLLQLQEDLHLPAFPSQIECFDNSNFQGSYPVAAMVYFKNGLPDKNEYRRFNIKTVAGINDFASMKEIVSRRYKRLLKENSGLAKNEEEIFFPGDKESIKLPWNSESLKLIRRIRDEVHRFGITFHRNQRSRGTFVNELEMIKGIGKNTADTLLKKYRSVKKIQQLSKEELTETIGSAKAEIVFEHFNKEEASPNEIN